MNIKEVRKNNTVRNLFPYLILVVIIGVTFLILSMGGTKVNELTTGELLKALREEKFLLCLKVVNLFIMLKVN